MILAGIDIGTNTLRLLIAEVEARSFRELFSDRIITRLGQDLHRTGEIAPEAGKRSLNALLDFAESIRRHDVYRTAAVGTSALRNASNAADFIVDAKKKTGLSINVISGEEEARLTLLGVEQALATMGTMGDHPLASALVIDIGGGSTEIILAYPGKPQFIASLSLGAVYLTETFIRHDPPSVHDVNGLRAAIREILDRTISGMQVGPATIFVGTAGSVSTLAAMDQKLVIYDPDRINGYVMTNDTISRLVEKLCTSTLAERRAMPGLEKGREDIIVAGAIITQEIMQRFGFPKMIVSDWGLREGIVLDLYEKMQEA
jgi:exopolyphosphatase / guanosine-5'-triphosphate,3'-diphosphate pyrophosphatase